MKSTKCAQCGFVGWSDVDNCKSCGAPLTQRSTYLPPPSPGYSTHYPAANQSEGEQKGLAIAALILGILSLFTFGLLVVGAIMGIVLAIKAMSRVRTEPWKYGGRGIAIAGLVLSILSLTTAPVGLVVAAIAVPNLMAARRAANEGSAMHSLRMISQAEAVYQSNFAKFGTLEELAASGLVDPNLGAGAKNGYNFTVTLDSANPDTFEVTGVPQDYRSSGTRSFYIDETFVMRGGDNFGGPSTKMDPPLDLEPELPTRSGRRIEYRPERGR